MAASDDGDAPTYPVKRVFVRVGESVSLLGEGGSISVITGCSGCGSCGCPESSSAAVGSTMLKSE